MLFSVLLANYNNSRFIEEALSSVFEQTYDHWEMIIVDDASEDNSRNILKEYEEDSRIKIFYNDTNKGCGYTKRKCVEKASGEICGFLDPDDSLAPEAIRVMVDNHKKFPEKGLIYSTYFRCDEKLNPKFIPPWVGEFQKNETQLVSSRISHFATFKRSVYSKTDGINPLLMRAVDLDLYLKLEEETETKFIDQPLYYYREHEGGISTNSNRYKAKYWGLMVSLDACERRGISKEDFFRDYLIRHEKKNSVIHSKEYKLGKIILNPIRKLYQFFK